MFRCHRKDNTKKACQYLCGLVQGNCPMGRAKKQVYDAEYYQLQHFITNSPWDSRPVMDKIARDADQLLGSDSMSCLVLTECIFRKKGAASAGTTPAQNISCLKSPEPNFLELLRQNPHLFFSKLQAKLDREPAIHTCQMVIFGALCRNDQATYIDTELYLPEDWTSSARRCEKAGIPESARKYGNFAELAWRIVERQRKAGLRFSYVYVDKMSDNWWDLCRRLDDNGENFLIRVSEDLRLYQHNLQFYVPPVGAHNPNLFPQYPVELWRLVNQIPPEEWETITIRNNATAEQSKMCRRQIWIRDSNDKAPRRYLLYVRKKHDHRKCFLSNLPESASLALLARLESNQSLADRALDNGIEVGIGDYQVRTWRGWHHHMTMVMLAMLFKLKQQIISGNKAAALSSQDIKSMLDDFLLKQAVPEQKITEQGEVLLQPTTMADEKSDKPEPSSPASNKVA